MPSLAASRLFGLACSVCTCHASAAFYFVSGAALREVTLTRAVLCSTRSRCSLGLSPGAAEAHRAREPPGEVRRHQQDPAHVRAPRLPRRLTPLWDALNCLVVPLPLAVLTALGQACAERSRALGKTRKSSRRWCGARMRSGRQRRARPRMKLRRSRRAARARR